MPLPAPHSRFSRLGPRLAAIGVAVALALGVAPAPASAATVGADGQPITNAKGVRFVLISHRGGALERPENSLEAYRYSVEQGFDVIETDLLFTSDGQGVMSHYDTLPSRCTYAGKKLHLMTLAQVRRVRCRDLSGAKTVPIPTFAELAQAVASSDIRIELDIKRYPGQSAAGERRYAERAIKLLKRYGLIERASILTFRWTTVLPTIRRLAPTIRVVGLDTAAMDYGRVRLAASLGLDGFGVRASGSPTNLLKYIKSVGMDPVPWEVKGTQLQAYAIHFAGEVYGVSSDRPAQTRAQLVGGAIDLNPEPWYAVTRLAKGVTVARQATSAAYQRRYPKVMGTAVPWSRLAALDSVRVKVTVIGGPGTGYLSLGAAGSPLSSSIKVKLPKGTKSLWVQVPVGNSGKLRVFASKRANYRVSVVEYTNLRFR